MIGYTTIGVTDMERGKKFYSDLFEAQGGKVLMDMGRIAFVGKDMKTPMLGICVPYNENDPSPGNGNMVAFPAGTKDNVKAMYEKAVALGATCDGEPGQRIDGQFYGAYVHDPDGNKLCFFVFG